MKSNSLTKQQEEIFRLVSAFEDRHLTGEKLSIDAYLEEIGSKTPVNNPLLKEYLISSELLVQSGRKRAYQTPKLTEAKITEMKSKLHQSSAKQMFGAPRRIGRILRVSATPARRIRRKK
jgi:hypothetical protein